MIVGISLGLSEIVTGTGGFDLGMVEFINQERISLYSFKAGLLAV